MTNNPYPEIIIDECSGIEVKSEKHEIWEKGYKQGERDLFAKICQALRSDRVIFDFAPYEQIKKVHNDRP